MHKWSMDEGRWKNFKTIEEIEAEEQAVSAYYRKQCENKEIDLIITYFYSACEQVKEFKIPCYYVYPGAMHSGSPWKI